jgi:hypothetical protein
MNLHEKQMQQACRYLEALEATLGLSPVILAKYKKGILTCSFYYLDQHKAGLREVKNDLAMLEAVTKFEAETNAVVYHCLWGWGGLAMLYVGQTEEDWRMVGVEKGDTDVWAAVPTPYRGLIDFGYVRLRTAKSIGFIGNLPIRIG